MEDVVINSFHGVGVRHGCFADLGDAPRSKPEPLGPEAAPVAFPGSAWSEFDGVAAAVAGRP